jgi:hypothetical protein
MLTVMGTDTALRTGTTGNTIQYNTIPSIYPNIFYSKILNKNIQFLFINRISINLTHL